MIGIDTNVLVRYLADDDAAQARKVDAFFAASRDAGVRLRIDDIVLCETVWVLRGAYRLAKPAIAAALVRVLGTAIFSFEDRELLRSAVDDYAAGPGDFADYLIGRRNLRAACDHTVSFDRGLADDLSFVLL